MNSIHSFLFFSNNVLEVFLLFGPETILNIVQVLLEERQIIFNFFNFHDINIMAFLILFFTKWHMQNRENYQLYGLS